MPVALSLMEEPALVHRVAAGDHEAFTRLVSPYLPALLGFAARLAQDHAAAEDALQDVLAQAYQTLQRKPEAELERLTVRPWLYKSLINRLRRTSRHRREIPGGLSVQMASGEDVEGTAERRALLARLEDELARLPAGWRAAILLRHRAGYSYEEIAQILGRSGGTVKAWVHRGTQRVRDSLSRQDKPADEGGAE